MTMSHDPEAAAIDPVCGMRVDPATGAHHAEHEGATYFFCGPGCKRAFEKAPRPFLADEAAPTG